VWQVNQRRNIPLQTLEPLADVDADFVSLQKGEPAESEFHQLMAQGWKGPLQRSQVGEFKDFADTAGMIEQLDLIISVDTSTAHLAGAMGKPVWLLNRYDTCWRWLLERPDSPWYPTLKLYRQPRAGDWDSVVHELHRDLGQWVTEQRNR